MNQNLEEALQMLKVQFPKVSKLELGLPVVITTITSLQPPPPPNFHIRTNFVCDGRYCCNRSLNITEKLNSNRFDIQKGRYTVFSIQWESRDLQCLIWIFESQKLKKKKEWKGKSKHHKRITKSNYHRNYSIIFF